MLELNGLDLISYAIIHLSDSAPDADTGIILTMTCVVCPPPLHTRKSVCDAPSGRWRPPPFELN